MLRRRLLCLMVVLLGAATGADLTAQSGSSGEKVLIRASKPYGALVSRIQALGGSVTHQYKHIDAIAAEIPSSTLGALRGYVATAAITKDEEIALPRSVDTLRGKGGLTASSNQDVGTADQATLLSGSEIAALAEANPQVTC